ncbi:transposase [Pseudogracilibacillus sp. SE30717A]|uniref:transposase n=1 Tax=Pseudogracilibacillus sp. SE30717A TaxID=3098293 RepID=UPI00300DF53D
MKIILVILSILIPIIMIYLNTFNDKIKIVFNSIAIISALIFGNISAISIYQIIRDNTVFMTAIHAVFLNPFFLITGALLGVYILYRLILLTLDEM